MPYVGYQLPFPLTSSSYEWYNPFKAQTHWGYDFNEFASRGDIITAAADGIVSLSPQSGPQESHGYRIELKHADGKYTGYCHMEAAPDQTVLYEGATVRRGQALGTVGNTGYIPNVSIGYHLHLSMATAKGDSIAGAGTCMDPIEWILDHPTEGDDPVPAYNHFEFAQSTNISPTIFTNLYISTGAASFISGPKLVSATATVKITGLDEGQWVDLRIVKISSQEVEDVVAQVTAEGRSGTTAVNIAGNANIQDGRTLRLQAKSSASGATVSNVDVVTHSWAS